MIARIKSALLLSLVLSFILVPSTAAHVLERQGVIGAVLHISPDDDPVAGITSNLYFDIHDQSGAFSAADCICTAVILSENVQMYSTSIDPASIIDNTAPVSYTFPRPAAYQVRLQGRPKTEGGFTSFDLTYDIRVERSNQGAVTGISDSARSVLIGLLALPFFVIYFAYINQRYKRRTKT